MAQQFAGSLAGFTARRFPIFFIVAIVTGASLLLLPWSQRPGRPALSVVDALFTATSATCVTGLTVRSTAADFSLFGQGVILLLMQIGGIGIVVITVLLLSEKASMQSQAVLAETLGIFGQRDTRSVILRVVGTVLAIEMTGFVALLLAAPESTSGTPAAWNAAFLSVSAFCNAGFALDDRSLAPFAGSLAVNAVVAGLVVVGGLGFPVLADLWRVYRGSRGRRGMRDFWLRLQLHTKMMLLGTAGLLAFGAAFFWLLEWDRALEGRSVATKLLMGVFHSVTLRTAGFSTIDYAALSSATLFLSMILMAVGAGPASTAGGFKVSTLLTLLVRGWCSLRGLRNANFCGRTIPPQAVERAAVTALLFTVLAGGALVVLLVAESGEDGGRPRWFLEAVFECISALGTVGLSTGITPLLSTTGKIVLVVLMLLGRLGPITVAVALSREQPAFQPLHPEEAPLVG